MTSEWYSDADGLLDLVKSVRSTDHRAPDVPGCSGLIELARGGQGIVYTAIQQSTGRRVAIKVLLDGASASPTARARFEREIDLIAVLRHPSIVRVYDRGRTTDGQPYFIMEYLDGLPWNEWVALLRDNDPQNARRRLIQVFIEVCDAVHAAHRHGIIHRDLKPSNLRVDSDGRPHVLDFGLARPAQSADGLRSGMTISESGAFVGSLPWASPEQAAGSGLADTRTDVYALGIILHHGLTDQFPYDVTGNLRDIIDQILEAEPARPSSASTGIEPDLDTITMTCLTKEPDRRYQSADALAADLRAFLRGEPISAKRAGAWTSMGRTARRYRTAFVVSAAVTFLAVVFAIVMAVMWNRAVDAERSAQQEANRASTVNDFILSMFGAIQEGDYEGDVTLRALLDRATQDLAHGPIEDARTAGLLEHTVGLSYQGIGDYVSAERHLRRSWDLHREATGPGHPRTIESATELVNVLLRQGAIEQAEQIIDEAVDSAVSELGPHHRATLAARFTQAGVSIERGDYADAALRLRDLASHQKEANGAKDALTLLVLSFVLIETGELTEAEALARQATDLRIADLGDSHPATSTARFRLCNALEARGKWGEAEPIRQRLIDDTYAQRGEGSLHLRYRGYLAQNLLAQGKNAEVLVLDTETLLLARRVHGEVHASTALAMARLAMAHQGMQQFSQAEQWSREAIPVAEQVFGSGVHQTVRIIVTQADAQVSLQRYADAATTLRHGLDAAEVSGTLDEENRGLLLGRLVNACRLGDRPDEAEAYQRLLDDQHEGSPGP